MPKSASLADMRQTPRSMPSLASRATAIESTQGCGGGESEAYGESIGGE